MGANVFIQLLLTNCSNDGWNFDTLCERKSEYSIYCNYLTHIVHYKHRTVKNISNYCTPKRDKKSKFGFIFMNTFILSLL